MIGACVLFLFALFASIGVVYVAVLWLSTGGRYTTAPRSSLCIYW